MKKYLILHPGSMGDIILTIPFLYSLHKETIHLTLMTQSWLLELHNIFKFIDQWQSMEGKGIHKLFGNNFNPDEHPWLGNYTKIIALFNHDREIKNNLLKGGFPFICNSFIPPSNFKKHITEHLSKILGIHPDLEFIGYNNTSQKSAPVIIHPGSGDKLKNWSIENYIKLADEFKKIGQKVLFLIGPAEIQITDLLKNAGQDYFSSERLFDVYKLLQSSKLYIGNDSGLTHLSSITGRKTIAIFGPTDPVVWKPAGRNVFVITKSEIPSCSPCLFRDNIIKCNNNQLCMPSFEEVSAFVRIILNKK